MAIAAARQARAASPPELRRLLRTPLEELGESTPGKPLVNLAGFMSHLRPVLNRAILGRAGRAELDLLARAVLTVYRSRRTLPHTGPYPLSSQLGVYDQFHFIWRSYLALLHAGTMTTEVAEAALKLILALGRALHRKSERYIVHNIFTAGCHGLFYIGRTMKELAESDAWDRLALAHLDTDWDRSFYRDGGHLERNWGYGSYTLRRLTDVWHFARRTGGLAGRERHFLAGLRRGYRFYAATCDGRNISPGFGDEGLGDHTGTLSAALSSGVFPPGTPPDLGIDRSRSYRMPGAGVAIMRSGGARDDAWTDVSFGEYAGWHSHQDLLSMDFRGFGKILIQDVPRFGPYEHAMDVLWRGPEAHNQLLVDTFRYDCRFTVGQDVFWHSGRAVDFFSAYHTAYRLVPSDHRTHHSSADLVVRRTIVFVKTCGYARVMDSVRPEGGDQFNRSTSCWWHSPQPFRLLARGLARTAGAPGALLAWAEPQTLRRADAGVDYTRAEMADAHPSLTGRSYNLRVRTWRDGATSPGCLGFVTVLYPFRRRVPKVSVRLLPLAGRAAWRAEAIEVRRPGGRDVFILNPERLHGLGLTARARIALAGGRKLTIR